MVTDAYSFDGWGQLTSSTGSTANSQLWKGEYLAYRKDPEAEPELQYSTHHRNYNLRTGVFSLGVQTVTRRGLLGENDTEG